MKTNVYKMTPSCYASLAEAACRKHLQADCKERGTDMSVLLDESRFKKVLANFKLVACDTLMRCGIDTDTAGAELRRQYNRNVRSATAAATLGEHHWEYRVSPEDVTAHDSNIGRAVEKYGRETLEALVGGRYAPKSGISSRDKVMLKLACDEAVAYLTGYAAIGSEEVFNDSLCNNIDIALGLVDLALQTPAVAAARRREKRSGSRITAARRARKATAGTELPFKEWAYKACGNGASYDFVDEGMNYLSECDPDHAVYQMEEMNELGYTPLEAVERAFHGKCWNDVDAFNPNYEYFTISNQTGNFLSIPEHMIDEYLMDEIQYQADKFKEWLLSNGKATEEDFIDTEAQDEED